MFVDLECASGKSKVNPGSVSLLTTLSEIQQVVKLQQEWCEETLEAAGKCWDALFSWEIGNKLEFTGHSLGKSDHC